MSRAVSGVDDAVIERQLDAALQALLATRSRAGRRLAYDRMMQLRAMRSPARVLQMELDALQAALGVSGCR